jgi:hypothetical protein
MKILLRTAGLSAALALIIFPIGHASPMSTGTCFIICSDLDSGASSTQYWPTTESRCCSETLNPCPAGSTPTAYSFQPDDGLAEVCG